MAPNHSRHNFSFPTRFFSRSFSNVSLASKKGSKGAASLFYDAPTTPHRPEVAATNVSTVSVPNSMITALPRIEPEDLDSIPPIPARFRNGPASSLMSEVQVSPHGASTATEPLKKSLWSKVSSKLKKVLLFKWFKKSSKNSHEEQHDLIIGSPTNFQHVETHGGSPLRTIEKGTLVAEATGDLDHIDEGGTSFEDNDDADDDDNNDDDDDDDDDTSWEDCEDREFSTLWEVIQSDGEVNRRESFVM